MKKIEIILTRNSRNPIGQRSSSISSIVRSTVYLHKLYRNVRVVLIITKLNSRLSKRMNNLHFTKHAWPGYTQSAKGRTHSHVELTTCSETVVL